ncbi:MAG: amidohydrolase family protein [Rubrivivax sp.]
MPLLAQTGAPWGSERTEGLRDNTPRWHAITGATLVLGPGQVVTGGTLVMRDGVITAAGAGVAVPPGAREWKLPGRVVYAGFIDLASPLGVPAALKPLPAGRPAWGLGSELPPAAGPRPEAKPVTQRGLASRNRLVRAEQDVAQQLEWRADEARTARELGFTTVLATPSVGVLRGQAALLALAEPGPGGDTKPLVLTPRAAQVAAFETATDGSYPSSQMGAIALTRQTLLDARWYAAASARTGPGPRLEHNATLAALAPVLNGAQPVLHTAVDEQDFARIARVRDEFKLRSWALGTGHEYRRAAQLAALKLPVVVPLAYPATPDLSDPDAALDQSLEGLQHWEQAPANLARLQQAGVRFAVTPHGLRDAKRDFWPRLRQAVQRGLPAEQALAALTTTPAALLGEAHRLGRLAPGQLAQVVVASGDLFTQEDAVVELAFVDGQPLPTDAGARDDLRGRWAVASGTEVLQIAGSRSAPRLDLGGPVQPGCEVQQRGGEWVLRLPCGKAAEGQPVALQRTVVARQQGDRWVGTVQRGLGPLQPWAAQRTGPVVVAAPAAASAPPVPAPLRPGYPVGMRAAPLPEQPAAVLVKNATLWTSAAAGKLEGADLLVRQGRIAAIGRGLTAPAGAVVVDAAGRHVTPGLIDAHSHIAISRGINEGTHSVTAEVRIADILDATDISLYRQLAGGLTSANILHGSANTIGGQSQVIKLRWGADADGLVFEGAQPGVKFALGENVKRANWGDGRRYPNTRMGVEQVLEDSFAAADEYRREWAAWRSAPRGTPEPRRDLQLEALVEILERRRAIHVHSYRADEILMFARFAKARNLDVAAFQHVLEGYKVADAIASIGAGGSTFSDWWNYKMEVVDAIPANGALMHRAGVLTSFNSDDAELARRLNTEAAKAMKYGGLSETEALALVTINPAKQLRVHQRTGSLEVGKDADFVLWSRSPLDSTTRAEQTWVDGRLYFDRAQETARREADAAERQRLLAAVAVAARSRPAGGGGGGGGGGTAPDAPRQFAEVDAADLGQLPWRPVLDHARAVRHAYSSQPAWHECTEDAR